MAWPRDAHALGFFADETFAGCKTLLERKANTNTSYDGLKRFFRSYCGLDETQLAVVMRDQAALDKFNLRHFDDTRVILKTLGKGSMGVVYQVLDTTLYRLLAIKEILPEHLSSPAAGKILRRFEREAKTMASIDHEAVVRLHEASVSPRGGPYIAMDYVPGRSLQKVIDLTKEGEALEYVLRPSRRKEAEALGTAPLVGTGELEIDLVVRWGQQLAEGLEACHRHGILHRDVKPANVLIGENRKARLTDFGVALDTHEERISVTGEVVGTPLYMPPEMFLGKRQDRALDAACDVYALGATIYHALIGEPPFWSDDRRRMYVLVATGVVPPPRRTRPEIPQALEAIVLRCLAKTPEERFQTAKDLADALGEFLSGAPLTPTPQKRDEKEARLPLLLALLAVALVVIVVLVVVVVVMSQR